MALSWSNRTHLSNGTRFCSQVFRIQGNSFRAKIRSGFWSSLVVFLAAIMNTGCTSSADRGSLEDAVKEIMVETMREKGQSLSITKLSLVHQGSNSYEGLAEGTLDGKKIQLEVYAVYDGINVKAEWQPTAAYVQEESNRIIEEQQREYDRMMKEYQKQADEAARRAEESYQKEIERQRFLNEFGEQSMY